MVSGQCSSPVKIVKHKRDKPLKSSEKTKVFNAFNKFKKIMNLCLSKSASLTQIKEHVSQRCNGTRNMHVSQTLGANGGRIHYEIPVYVRQSEINESTWICWHQDRSSTEFGYRNSNQVISVSLLMLMQFALYSALLVLQCSGIL